MPSIYGHHFGDEAYLPAFGMEQMPVPIAGAQVMPEPVWKAIPEAPFIDDGICLDEIAI